MSSASTTNSSSSSSSSISTDSNEDVPSWVSVYQNQMLVLIQRGFEKGPLSPVFRGAYREPDSVREDLETMQDGWQTRLDRSLAESCFIDAIVVIKQTYKVPRDFTDAIFQEAITRFITCAKQEDAIPQEFMNSPQAIQSFAAKYKPSIWLFHALLSLQFKTVLCLNETIGHMQKRTRNTSLSWYSARQVYNENVRIVQALLYHFGNANTNDTSSNTTTTTPTPSLSA